MKLSSIRWSDISIGFGLGFVLCLVGIGFWPSGPEHNYQPDQNPDGHGTYQEIAKTWGEWFSAIWDRTREDPIALYTLVLGISTVLLWITTARIARDARDSARTLISMERPYVASGGDFENDWGKELFRLDIENHGKTAAFMVAFDLQFARLKELKEEFPEARKLRCKHYSHIDSLSPMGARKIVRTQIEKPKDADIIFGCVWYEDIWRAKYSSRFILRIAATRDIPKEGLTRLSGLEGVSSDYWKWEYPKKEHA
jgi:hypothetical protein